MMKKLLHKNFFTLVEVLIAMGICVVGLCSVVVFFPIGANASRNASMASYAANVAEQILNFAKFCIETDMSASGDGASIGTEKFKNFAFRYFTSPTGLVGSGPDTPTAAKKENGWNPNNPSSYWSNKPVPNDTYKEESYGQALDYLLDKIEKSNQGTTGTIAGEISPFSKGMTRYITNMLQTVSSDDFAKVTSEIIPYKNNVFYARFVSRDTSKTTDNEGDSVYSDFDCFASLWATPIPLQNNMDPNTHEPQPPYIPYAMRLHVTVSWPADLPYENRQKREYSLDIFKQY